MLTVMRAEAAIMPDHKVKKLAFGYVRVSTEAQATEGVSLEAQTARIQSWCANEGYELVEVMVDAGISGKKSNNRPGLLRALNAVCDANGALVVYSLSRMARSTIDAITISQRLDKANADLVSLTEKIDTTSAAGKMIFRLLALLAEFERDVISERTATALNLLRKNNQRISGKIPFGHDLAPDGKTLISNPGEQATLIRIRQLHAAGTSLRGIAATLTADGVLSKAGKPWGASSIQAILAKEK